MPTISVNLLGPHQHLATVRKTFVIWKDRFLNRTSYRSMDNLSSRSVRNLGILHNAARHGDSKCSTAHEDQQRFMFASDSDSRAASPSTQLPMLC